MRGMELVKDENGLCLMLHLSATEFAVKFDGCKQLSGGLIRRTGIDLAPLDKLIGVGIYLDENNPLLCEGINLFLGKSDPLGVWTRNLRLVLDNLSKAKVGRFILIPENGVIKSGHISSVSEPATVS